MTLTNNCTIKTSGLHLEDPIIDNNYELNIDHTPINHINYDPNFEINDPSIKLQKCLEVTGITKAWKYCNFNKERIIKVAIIDTGVDTNHPDLIDNFYKDTNNEIIGKRFYDNNKSDANFDDDNGHGTHVAGIIAARSDNNLGISGISANNKIKIMPIKCINRYSDGYYSNNSDIANAIKWATDEGADIINLSLGGITSSDLIKNNIRYANKKGCLVIAAVGNGQGFVEFPAAYPEVLSVGSIDEDNNLAYFSSFKTNESYPEKPEGHRGVDVVAPGLKVYSTFDNSDKQNFKDTYSYLTGTSMSTPIVTGLAALLMQQHDNYYRNPNIVRKIILFSSENCGIEKQDGKFGYGLINAKSAILYPWTASFYQLDKSAKLNINFENKMIKNEVSTYRKSNISKKETNSATSILNSLKSNSLLYGSGLALMLGYMYYSGSESNSQENFDDDDEWQDITDTDIDSMTKDELIKLEKYLMKKYYA